MNTQSTQSSLPTENVEILRKPPALRVIDSYSGFVTNQAFKECRPSEGIVYAVVQYLSFFSIKCSARNIAKHANLSVSTIKNDLCSLRKRRFIVKQDDGTYLFGKVNLNGSTEPVAAKELSRPQPGCQHLGYWFPLDILKSEKINNQAKRAFALILNLIKTGSNQIQMSYIAEKLDLSRVSASKLIAKLLSERFISRHRPHPRSAYFYQIGVKEMRNHKKELSTGHEGNSIESDQGTQNDTSKGTQNDTYSITLSSISIRESRTERELAPLVSRESKSPSLEKTVEHISSKVGCLEREAKEIAQESKSLDQKYTEACVNRDWKQMTEVRNKAGYFDVKKIAICDEIATAKGITSNHLYMLNKKQMPMLKQHHINQIGSAIKAALPELGDAKTRKRVFCLKMNSVLCDIKLEFCKLNKSWHYQSRQEATMSRVVRNCLMQAQRSDYRINEKVSMGFGQIKSASNDSNTKERSYANATR